MREREKVRAIKQLRSSSESMEAIVAFLRKEKTSKIQSIRLLHLALGMSLGEAKKVVFLSKTWSDRFASDEAFLDSIMESLDRLLPEQADAA